MCQTRPGYSIGLASVDADGGCSLQHPQLPQLFADLFLPSGAFERFRYEELERLLEAPDADHETITRMVRELEDVQAHALQDLGKAEMAAQVDEMRLGAGLDLTEEDEDEFSPSFHAAVEKVSSCNQFFFSILFYSP